MLELSMKQEVEWKNKTLLACVEEHTEFDAAKSRGVDSCKTALPQFLYRSGV